MITFGAQNNPKHAYHHINKFTRRSCELDNPGFTTDLIASAKSPSDITSKLSTLGAGKIDKKSTSGLLPDLRAIAKFYVLQERAKLKPSSDIDQ